MQAALYHTSVLTPGGVRWIDYGPAREVSEPVWLVMGSATFGRALDGGPALHCHAVLSGGSGIAGGHLAPDRSVIGEDGLVAHATSGGWRGVRRGARSQRLRPVDPGMSGLLLVRLSAGSDLVEGIEAAARAHGVRHGIVHGGPGSLMRACVQAGGAPVEVPGPAAEILTMVGEIRDGAADLHGTVGDPDGRVYGGRFVRGRNNVLITVELAIEPIGETTR